MSTRTTRTIALGQASPTDCRSTRTTGPYKGPCPVRVVGTPKREHSDKLQSCPGGQ